MRIKLELQGGSHEMGFAAMEEKMGRSEFSRSDEAFIKVSPEQACAIIVRLWQMLPPEERPIPGVPS